MASLFDILRRRATKNVVEANYVDPEGHDVLGIMGKVVIVDQNGDNAPIATTPTNSNQVYSSAGGDFTATVVAGTKEINVVGTDPAWVWTEANVLSIQAITSAGELINLPIEGISVLAGTITVNGYEDLFDAADVVVVKLEGPEKTYDQSYDASKVLVQNPEYAHTTPAASAGSGTNMGLSYIADATSAGPVLGLASETFSEANVANGYTIYNVTTAANALITALTPNVDITAAVAGGWTQNDVASVPEVRRIEIDMDTYKYLSIHYRLTAAANENMHVTIWGTNDTAATTSADTGWVDMTEFFLGVGTLEILVTGATDEGMIVTVAPVVVDRLMVKIVLENDGTVAPANSFDIFVKKA